MKLRIPAGSAAARASGEYQDKNIRSMNCCTDQDPVLKIKGNAMLRIWRYPFSCCHRFKKADFRLIKVSGRAPFRSGISKMVPRQYYLLVDPYVNYECFYIELENIFL